MNLASMRRHALTDEVDVVVIGTGAGGAPLLARLAARGLSCVALEAGPNHDPAAYTPDEIFAAPIYWTGERLVAGGTPQAFGGNNSGRGVGGSTLHWGAFTPWADARDLRLHTESGLGTDWPLTRDDLVPYYREIESFIGTSGPTPYPWDPERRFPLPPVPRNAPAHAMARACDALGLRATDAPAAILSHPYAQPGIPARGPCRNCGYCHQGCRFDGAKTSMDVTYLPLALTHGAEIRPDSTAHGFERDQAGRITAVLYRNEGQDHRQRCRAVVLAAGAVETPRLLLHTGLANGSGQVGRNYMAHVATQVWGTFDADMRGNKGYPSSLITEDLVRPHDADFAGGYIIQSLGVVAQTWAEGAARARGLWGQPLVDYIAQYNRTAGIGINGECLPYEGNTLTLADETDELGIPKAKVRFTHGKNEQALDAHATRLMHQLWQAAGATDTWTGPRQAHTIGTARMGTDKDASVVDPYGRSHEIANLWISDNSTFPSSLAANPALTIMALSLRTADHFSL